MKALATEVSTRMREEPLRRVDPDTMTAERKQSPQYRQTATALERLIADISPGTFLPSEPDLAHQLGVSRATLREAMRTFEERGLIVRRQGVGTYVASPAKVLETGLEVLESIETLAMGMGIEVEMGELSVCEHPTPRFVSGLFEHPQESSLLEIARTVLVDGSKAAYLIDIMPEYLVPQEVMEPDFKGSVLDLLLNNGNPNPLYSRTELTAVPATEKLARRLEIEEGAVLLKMEANLFDEDRRVIDHSISYFIPDAFRFHILRRVRRLT